MGRFIVIALLAVGVLLLARVLQNYQTGSPPIVPPADNSSGTLERDR